MSRPQYSFIGTCVDLNGDFINDMKRKDSDDIVDVADMRENCAGFDDQVSGLGYAVGDEEGLRVEDDYAVRFAKSTYTGVPCYYMVYSAIEHVWTLNGEVNSDYEERQDQARSCLSARRRSYINERYGGSEQSRGIWYHGTHRRNLRSILSQGLIPSPKHRAWDSDSGAGPDTPDRTSYGGIYLTKNLLTATSSANPLFSARGKGWGREDPVVVVVEIQERSVVSDEDSISNTLKDIGWRGFSSNHEWTMAWLYFTSLRDPDHEELVRMRDEWSVRNTDYLVNAWFQRDAEDRPQHPKLYARVLEQVKAAFIPAVARRLAYWGANNPYEWRSTGTRAGFEYDSVPPPPSKTSAEAAYREAVDPITKTLKELPRNEIRSGRFNVTSRSLEPIRFRGSNRILAVIELVNYMSADAGAERSLAVHFGTPPEQFLADYRKFIGQVPPIRSQEAVATKGEADVTFDAMNPAKALRLLAEMGPTVARDRPGVSYKCAACDSQKPMIRSKDSDSWYCVDCGAEMNFRGSDTPEWRAPADKTIVPMGEGELVEFEPVTTALLFGAATIAAFKAAYWSLGKIIQTLSGPQSSREARVAASDKLRKSMNGVASQLRKLAVQVRAEGDDASASALEGLASDAITTETPQQVSDLHLRMRELYAQMQNSQPELATESLNEGDDMDDRYANGDDTDGDCDIPSCPGCAGQPMYLGHLGERAHFRCRGCGLDYSRVMKVPQSESVPVDAKPLFAALTEGFVLSVRSTPGDQDYFAMFGEYVNSKFRGQEDMEMRIVNHAMDFAQQHGLLFGNYKEGKDEVIEFATTAVGLSPAAKAQSTVEAKTESKSYDVVGYAIDGAIYCTAHAKNPASCKCAQGDRDENGLCQNNCDGYGPNPVLAGEAEAGDACDTCGDPLSDADDGGDDDEDDSEAVNANLRSMGEAANSNERRVRTTYSNITSPNDGSGETGEDHGWEDEGGVDHSEYASDPNQLAYHTAKTVLKRGHVEPSSSHGFGQHDWFSTVDAEENRDHFEKGHNKYYGMHLVGYSDAERQLVHDYVMRMMKGERIPEPEGAEPSKAEAVCDWQPLTIPILGSRYSAELKESIAERLRVVLQESGKYRRTIGGPSSTVSYVDEGGDIIRVGIRGTYVEATTIEATERLTQALSSPTKLESSTIAGRFEVYERDGSYFAKARGSKNVLRLGRERAATKFIERQTVEGRINPLDRLKKR